ncbi:LysM peptidoglycan-binding domain-containing protein [Desulfonatronovibrio magnus]|uniref:LysM peptidoglycan-binding domain-containing protein n=1 Tax=Desulfonatronovibrio magnus TaxID=698827 RepID=UPI0005EAE621|nr:LysM domain-containing protein [Desulfonatronovibrio magnus]
MEKKNWINKLDDLEQETPVSSGRRNVAVNAGRQQENMIIYALAAAGAIILILIIVIFARGGSSPEYPVAELREVIARMDTLEHRVMEIEGQLLGRDPFAAEPGQTADLRAALEAQRETLDDLRQRFSEMEDQSARVASRPAPQPAPRPAPEPAPRPAPPEPAAAPSADADHILHEVQPGENLFRIGLRHNISVDRIRELNNLSPNDAIHPGQKLIVGTRNN